MGFKISSIMTNTDLEEQGVEVQFADDFYIKLGRLGNRKYRRYFQQISKPHIKSQRADDISPDLAEDLEMQSIARHIILGWRGLEEDDGTEIPYTPAKALELMRACRDFYTRVRDLADDANRYRNENLTDSEGN